MRFFQLIPPDTNIDFVSKYQFFVVFSSILCIGAITLMFTKGFNFGIDFTGGTVLQIKLAEPSTIDAVRKVVTDAGAPEATVAMLGHEGLEYLISAQGNADPKSGTTLGEKIQASMKGTTISQSDTVGPKVGSELKLAALLSLFYSTVLIMLYIWFRFDFKFAPGATVALVHDLILTAGFYVILGMEFDITAVAALLTIAGYSVNDTIVIYDRVRAMLAGNTAGMSGDSFGHTVNHAINVTLSRTLLTSGLTLISVLPVAIFCEGTIQSFGVAMIFGILVGSYSTIYIAAPMTLTIQRWSEWKAKSAR